ncbi:hypothetical protein [Streptomyces sp. KS 21]|uniref:hypothetical protein n=1 Tax=Streptomyces sp. KS 21 TaxID=2485150 RepID=UPI0010CFD73B|nr:hypothetical protein [Streptomyces sp. KS 21]TDU80679.1 hypothetical protein EDD91_7588 [Streptomyces sp. KS 21]
MLAPNWTRPQETGAIHPRRRIHSKSTRRTPSLPHTPPMYRRLSAQVAQARRVGRFPDLIDTVREVHIPPAWPSVDTFVREMPDWFRLDRTEGQEHALYVAAEKDTLRQQLTGWLAETGVPVLVVRGFSSQSYADVVRERVTRGQRAGVLVVVGDFDCSGEDIERDWVARTGCWSRTERVLLTYDQVRAYGLPATGFVHENGFWLTFRGACTLSDGCRASSGEVARN